MAKRRRSHLLSKGWWLWKCRQPLEWLLTVWNSMLATYRKRFPRTLTDDEQWEVWKADVETIKGFIVDLFGDRLVFRETTDIMRANPKLAHDENAGYWYAWLRLLYAHFLAMAVRRELDRGADAPNLYRLLHQISRRPKVLSRKRYLSQFGDDVISRFEPGVRDRNFTDIAGSGAYIDSKIVKRDLKEIDKRSKDIVHYANVVVAHRTGQDVETTMEHANQSLEAIEDILQKYYAILTGDSLIVEPSILVPWQLAFREPWMK